MSFRLRALLLILFVASTATAATAWLTLRQASQQIRDSVAADQQNITHITEELRRYGLDHGTWAGVTGLISRIADRTGQRIRVVSVDATLLADSDEFQGRPVRETVGAPVLVDPRPTLRLPSTASPGTQVRLASLALARYESGIAFATCLTEAGLDVTAALGEDGIPSFTAADPAAATAAGCTDGGESTSRGRQGAAEVSACAGKPASGVASCLMAAFTTQISTFAPPPVQVYTGAAGERVQDLPTRPTVVVATAVTATAILVSLLLSQGVLRPVRALIAASSQLGKGDLSHRVPVSGRDEIARLARSFNRMADSLQASENRQQQLTSDIAHELRTPLANLRGYLEALRDGVVEPTSDLLASLHEEVLLQQRIVEDLQDLTMAEVGALTYHMKPVDLGGLLRTCVIAHRDRAEAAGVRLDLDLVEAGGSAGHPVTVIADADRLRQAVGNLITNAIRACASGGSIVLGLRMVESSVLIEVRDTGTGIAPQDVPNLFNRFWRADAARGRATGGSGLGLAITRQIVTDHDGTIHADSAVGVGTVVAIRLPVPA
ncbi:MAG: HAMP domain-containing protein [Micromonosporaceae bacterium]|nr:HAMP domain-containing protein [Micromonosporaceae bacterium]